MQLNKDCMKAVLNQAINDVKFDVKRGEVSTLLITKLIENVVQATSFKKEEIGMAIYRCAREGFLYTNLFQPGVVWLTAKVEDVSLSGFTWLEHESN